MNSICNCLHGVFVQIWSVRYYVTVAQTRRMKLGHIIQTMYFLDIEQATPRKINGGGCSLYVAYVLRRPTEVRFVCNGSNMLMSNVQSLACRGVLSFPNVERCVCT